MSATTPDVAAPSRRGQAFSVLQKIGRSLMLPIAVLPAAAILLRLGQADLLGEDGSGLEPGRRDHRQRR